MADEPSEDLTKKPTPDAGRRPDWTADPRTYQRNLAERLFPGPTKQMTEQVAQRIENLIKEGGNEEALAKWRERQARRQSGGGSRRSGGELAAPAQPKQPTKPPAQVEAPVDATADELTVVSEKLEQQNELLRALLQSSVDTQTDARSTAQNSRTFAWAGTAIGLLTLIATVITVIEAIQGH